MVNIADKTITKRNATAQGRVYIPSTAYKLLHDTYPITPKEFLTNQDAKNGAQQKAIEKSRRKGDALTIAQLAGIMGAKRTADLIPLCHPLVLSNIQVTLTLEQLSECEPKTAISFTDSRISKNANTTSNATSTGMSSDLEIKHK